MVFNWQKGKLYGNLTWNELQSITLLSLSLSPLWIVMALRFPFSFPHQPPNQPNKPSGHRHFPLVAAAASIGLGVGLSLYLKSSNQPGPVRQNPWAFASLSLADGASATSVEPKTGVSFPSVLDGTRRLLGVGVRKKSVFGLKNIDVYAFGN